MDFSFSKKLRYFLIGLFGLPIIGAIIFLFDKGDMAFLGENHATNKRLPLLIMPIVFYVLWLIYRWTVKQEDYRRISQKPLNIGESNQKAINYIVYGLCGFAVSVVVMAIISIMFLSENKV